MSEREGGQHDLIVYPGKGEGRSNTSERLQRAREYWIDHMAFTHFRIPVENIQHPTIRHYIGAFNDTYALWENTGNAIDQNDQARMYRAAGSWEHLVQRGLAEPVPPGIHATYPMRLVQTRELVGEANACLEFGFGGFPSEGYIDTAVRLYGCAARYTQEVEEPLVKPGSLWRAKDAKEKRKELREFLPSGPVPRQNYLYRNHERLEPIPRFGEIAERLGIPPSYWKDPETRRYISLISDTEALIRALRAGEDLPDALGLSPSVRDRYRAAAGILQFNVAMLQEGFAGNTLTPDFVERTFAPLASFGIAVVKVPPSQ